MTIPEDDVREEMTVALDDLTYRCVHGIDTIYDLSAPIKTIENANGIVRVIDSNDGARLAIKQFQDIDYEENEDDILCEMHALQKIKGRHPSLCSIIEIVADWTARRFTIVMPYYPRELMDVCNEARPHGLGSIHKLAIDIAAGLACLHSLGMIHRDLWPGNICVTESHTACIIDYGTALDTTLLTQPQSPKYTNVTMLPYRAPELLEDDGYYGTEVDIWSLGCVLIEMFTGQRFFPTHVESVLRSVHALYKPPAPPAHVPLPGGWKHVKTPMTWDKKARPTAAQVHARLEQTLNSYKK